jgi:hypothetical protein
VWPTKPCYFQITLKLLIHLIPKIAININRVIDRMRRFSLPELTFSQKDKLADFAINFAVAWFVAAVIGPFFTLLRLTFFDVFRILVGVILGIGFLFFALLTAKVDYESPKR